MFDVWYTPTGREDYNNLRADIRSQVDAAQAALERRGCAAADYRLSGEHDDLGRHCVVHLDRDWRVILGFPASNEVVVLLIGQHLRGARNIYARLYRLLDVFSPPDERKKPPCCGKGGEPPVAPEIIDRIVVNAKRLRRTS